MTGLTLLFLLVNMRLQHVQIITINRIYNKIISKYVMLTRNHDHE
jgi:hypothetical protein